MIRIKKGLDLPLAGEPEQQIHAGNTVRKVAVLGADYPGMRPTLLVSEGDLVKRGQPLFEDKKNPGVIHTAPAAGRVLAVNRGAKRFMLSVVIDTTEGGGDQTFEHWREGLQASTDTDTIRKLLIESGEWTALKTRPYGRSPAVDSQPQAIFVTAMDTNPVCGDPDLVIGEQPDAFRDGLRALSTQTKGTVWVCRRAGSELKSFAEGNIREESFAGPHPAGNAGTHIHHLNPIDRHREVWSIDYQNVIAIGKLMASGKLYSDRVIAIGGPQAKTPRLVRAQSGASVDDLLRDEIKDGNNRIVAGSVFNGHHAKGPVAFLGRQHHQVTVLAEGDERQLFGYLSLGLNDRRHSFMNIYLNKLFGKRPLNLTASTNGSERAMVPLGHYEGVFPFDTLPAQLLRSLIVGDMEMAEKLGALELVEEDLALCSYVCVGKYEYGPILRDNLDRIQSEG